MKVKIMDFFDSSLGVFRVLRSHGDVILDKKKKQKRRRRRREEK